MDINVKPRWVREAEFDELIFWILFVAGLICLVIQFADWLAWLWLMK
jgi:hypothetical protein